ncbi:MAG: HD domain-containing phosphohydrolase [Pseudomonadota bacterium]
MQEAEQAQRRLLAVIRDIAEGRYSNEIMALTRDDAPEPMRTVAEAMALMMVKVEAREFRLEGLVAELRELNQQIRRNTIGVVSALANALAARNAYTEGHASRVGELGAALAQRLCLDAEAVELVRLGGVLHDIGKINFSDRLFEDHDARLPKDLVKVVLRHPEVGYNILRDLDFLGPALDYVRCHHERLDGSGYPRNVKADEIPLGARILAVADGFDAMTTDRPYQKGMEHAVALANLRKQVPHRLDQEVVEALAAMIAEGALPAVEVEGG